MRILFDNGVPAPLRYALEGHVVVEAIERGWDRLLNGDLISPAEADGFDVLLTTDKTFVTSKTCEDGELPSWFSATSNGPSCSSTFRESWRL